MVEMRVRGGGDTPRLSENKPFPVNKYGFLYLLSVYIINDLHLDAKRISAYKQLRRT